MPLPDFTRRMKVHAVNLLTPFGQQQSLLIGHQIPLTESQSKAFCLLCFGSAFRAPENGRRPNEANEPISTIKRDLVGYFFGSLWKALLNQRSQLFHHHLFGSWQSQNDFVDSRRGDHKGSSVGQIFQKEIPDISTHNFFYFQSVESLLLQSHNQER